MPRQPVGREVKKIDALVRERSKCLFCKKKLTVKTMVLRPILCNFKYGERNSMVTCDDCEDQDVVELTDAEMDMLRARMGID